MKNLHRSLFFVTFAVGMRLIKRLHWLVLKSFLPLFAMTFFIVLFIVLMQFLWKYVDELVGKGLEISVIAELFFYAAVSMVPMSLPLAILLASLMTFGNFGEKFELTAMKASGISLLRVMMPLIILVSSISVGAFFFQNDVLPRAQVKMWTLLFSIKQKSPETEIIPGVFNSQIPNYNVFVKDKDQNTGMLRGVMIYGVSGGGANATILVADSAHLSLTKDRRYMFLHLFNGEQFENLREQLPGDRNVPFRREEFLDKQVLIPFDVNFNRLDDDQMRKQYVGKNISELRQTIDSVSAKVDSVGDVYAVELQMLRYGGLTKDIERGTNKPMPYRPVAMPAKVPDLDSILAAMPANQASDLLQTARRSALLKADEYEFKSLNMAEENKSIRRHQIELIKKFTLSVACLIFFFIGAPLGAIIRKGGIGTPLVISVLLFLVYYIIDNTGYKMARDGRWPVYVGMWISTAVLAPLGIFATYKAMNDSVLFSKDAYMHLLRRIFGLRQKRGSAFKEVIINDIDATLALQMINRLDAGANAILRRVAKPMGYIRYWFSGVNNNTVKRVALQTDMLFDYLSDSRDAHLVRLLSNYPIITSLWLYRPAPRRWMAWTAVICFPIGVPVWIFGNVALRRLRTEMKAIKTTDESIRNILLNNP
ncbi:putative uncharacterized protein [Prevotella sp. CAG:485]|nr:putative uncharacterized protein [Prevotella sp. CAG:485]